MKDQLILAAAMSSALLFVTNANASPESRSAQACSHAIAEKVAAGTSVGKVSYAYSGAVDSAIAAYFATSYTFEVSVKDAKSGAPIASAMCTTRRDGTVLQLTSIQMRDAQGKLAAVL